MPSFLTIVGVILFLRTGWVVGHAGLIGALLIIVLAHTITFSTSFSLSSIATNMKVGTGGAYYLISRSLGLEAGAALGIPLYLSQTLSITFYVLGFAELARSFFPWIDSFYLGSMTLAVITLISFVGADWAMRSQYLILAVIGLALLSFFVGDWSWDVKPILWTDSARMPYAFAVFFPAVTGIMSGLSMSGDLKNPDRQIPKGTLWAVGITFLIYLAVPLVLAFNVPAQRLLSDPEIMFHTARFPVLVVLGLVGGSLSSALGTVVGAPRTLQALAKDRVVPGWMGRGYGKAAEPRIATLISYVLAQASLLLGDLNFVASLLTVFFLITYGTLNLSAFLETVLKSPSFRPRFKTPWPVSLYGAVGCAVVMFLINPAAAVLAAVVVFGIYLYTQRRGLHTTWGDARAGFWFSLARSALLRIEKASVHPRNWRPNTLVISSSVKPNPGLLNLIKWLGHSEGISIMAYPLAKGPKQTVLRALENLREHRGLEGLMPVVYTDGPDADFTVMETVGLGGLRPNTLLMDWKDATTQRGLAAVRKALDMGWSTMGLKCPPEGLHRGRRIDMWWRGLAQSGHLMLLVSHLILQNEEWHGGQAAIRMILRNPASKARAETYLHDLISQARVNARPEIIVHPDPDVPAIINQESQGADLVIMGSGLPEPSRQQDYLRRMNLLTRDLRCVLVLRSGGGEKVLDL